MEQLQLINLKGELLKDLPLFFRKIYYNKITDLKEEQKLMKHSSDLQCDLIRDNFPVRQISKTISYKIFKSVPDGQ